MYEMIVIKASTMLAVIKVVMMATMVIILVPMPMILTIFRVASMTTAKVMTVGWCS